MTIKSRLCTANEIEQMLLPLLVNELATAQEKLKFTTDDKESAKLVKEIELLKHEINDMSPEQTVH